MTINEATNKIAFDSTGAIFMGAKREINNSVIGLYGVNYDGTTSFRPGARFGPSEIKNVSYGIESFCPQLNADIEEINFTDFGNVEIPLGDPQPVIEIVKKTTEYIYSLNMKPLLLGGEHSLTSGSIHGAIKYFPDLIVIQLDAHADLRDEWLGSKYNHACAMRRCLEILPSHKLFQVGIRSGTKKEILEMKKEKRLINQNFGKPSLELYKALKPYRGRPIYLTVDLDWFDPSIMSGTGTPEPGGFLWQDFASVIDVLKEHNLIGADIVELAPQLDPSGVSTILAAKTTRSLLILLSLSKINTFPVD